VSFVVCATCWHIANSASSRGHLGRFTDDANVGNVPVIPINFALTVSQKKNLQSKLQHGQLGLSENNFFTKWRKKCPCSSFAIVRHKRKKSNASRSKPIAVKPNARKDT
jgi:hypothetical protein